MINDLKKLIAAYNRFLENWEQGLRDSKLDKQAEETLKNLERLEFAISQLG